MEEAEEIVQRLSESLAHMEDPVDRDLVNEVFRLTHSLKSESAVMGYSILSSLSHAMEDVLGKVRSGGLALGRDVLDLLMAAADRSAVMMAEISRTGSEDGADAQDLVSSLAGLVEKGSASGARAGQTAASGAPGPARGEPAFDTRELRRIEEARDRGESLVRLTVRVIPDEPMKFARAFLVFSNLEQVVNVIRSVPSLDGLPAQDSEYAETVFYLTAPPDDQLLRAASRVDQIESVSVERIGFPGAAVAGEALIAAESAPSETSRPRPAEKTSIRVDTRKLDDLWSFVAELVLHKAHISRLCDGVARGMDSSVVHDELLESADSLEKLSSGMQQAMRDTRMIPISIIFSKFPRLVRDLSRKLGKPVELTLVGEDTEIDRSLVESLSDPLTHVIRNSLDHGLEFPEERVRLGKPEKGKITVSARRQGGTIVIELADDGRGLDTERIRAKAVDVGIADAASLSDAAVRELVFLPGFSTKDVVTDVSGRGVGMDVVATRIRNDLRGDVELASEAGRGTRVILRLPLTLTIVNSLLLADQGQLYAVPLADLDSTAKLVAADISLEQGAEVAPWMGEGIPVHSMPGLLGGDRTPREEYFAVVLRHGESRGFLIVDELMEEREIVIKPVDDLVNPLRLFSGVSIL
ncbi:MAG TPA: chemotaxis protein CheA, partial [Spirochaetia bacterium]|nr:chemotaxis protein CheA [Spirochaetia bacterium]